MMNNSELAELIRLLAQELADNVIAREKIAEQHPGSCLSFLVPKWQSKKAICDDITHLRQTLLVLKKAVEADAR